MKTDKTYNIRIMKTPYRSIGLLLIFVASIYFNSSVFGESLDLKSDNISLLSAIERISKEYGVYFTFDMTLVSDVTVDYEENTYSTAEEAISHILRGTNLKYKFYDQRFVILYREDEEGLESLKKMSHHLDGLISEREDKASPGIVETRKTHIVPLLERETPIKNLRSKKPQEIEVSGIVTDAFDDDPLIGVNVYVAGKDIGTTTDIDGMYEISVNKGDTLTFSYIGYEPQKVVVKDLKIINVRLSAQAEVLEEAVVVAFGRQKKINVIGSVSSISPSELKVPVSNLTQALTGRLSGLIGYQRSGEPGKDNADFFIRGVTTFGYSRSPLILLDGFEISSNEMAQLDPSNIESFSIMKDATSTALYGARGANGVILITTKEGREGDIKVSFRHETAFSMPTKLPEVVDGVQYMDLYNEAFYNDAPNENPYYSAQKIEGTKNAKNRNVYPNVNWYDELFRKTVNNHRYNLNISGGGKVGQYFISSGFNQEHGILKVDKRNNFNNNIKINRYYLRTNVNLNLTPTTKMLFKINSHFERYNGPIQSGTDIFQSVMSSNPVDFPKYYEPDSKNIYTDHILFGRRHSGGLNPYAQMISGYQDQSINTVIGTFQIEQDLKFITEGLNAKLSANVRSYGGFSSERSYNPYYYEIESYNIIDDEYKLNNVQIGDESLGDPATDRNANSRTYFELSLNYSKTLNQHNISSLLVYTQSEELNTILGGTIEHSLPRRNLGFAGRMTYDFEEKYLLEFNFGYNGSERFSKNNQFGFFPSIGLAYNIANESFFDSLKDILPIAKLKFTYGLVGNDAIGAPTDRFYYLSRINQYSSWNGYRFGNTFNNIQNGYSIERYSNFDITWEEALKKDIGLELNIKDNYVFIIDYFSELRKNIFMERVDLPIEMGLTSLPSGNIGKVKSYGVDLSLDFDKIFNNGKWMQGRVNYTYATNRIVEFSEPFYREKYLSRIGYPVDQQWGYLSKGMFIDQDEINNYPIQTFGASPMVGDIRYIDINGDGIIDSNDKIPIGKPTVPEIIFGTGLSFGIKDLDLSFFLQGSLRSSFFINPAQIEPFTNNSNILKIIAEDYWSHDSPNPESFWPRLSTVSTGNNSQTSDKWIRDHDFVRLKNLEIGYSFSSLTNRWNIDLLRMFVSGTNMFVLSKFKLWDPEMGSNGLGYPIQKSFNIGLELNF